MTWSDVSLSVELGMSPSQLHSAVKRSLAASLAIPGGEKIAPNISNREEFLVHGLKYVLVDGIRAGRARERDIVSKELRARLQRYA